MRTVVRVCAQWYCLLFTWIVEPGLFAPLPRKNQLNLYTLWLYCHSALLLSGQLSLQWLDPRALQDALCTHVVHHWYHYVLYIHLYCNISISSISSFSSIYLSIFPYIYLAIYLSCFLSVFLWFYLSFFFSVNLIYLSSFFDRPKMVRTPVFLTIWLAKVLRATTACKFSTSELTKLVRIWCVFLTFWLGNVLRPTTACNSSFLISFGRMAPHRFREPTSRPSRPTNHWKHIVFCDFFELFAHL